MKPVGNARKRGIKLNSLQIVFKGGSGFRAASRKVVGGGRQNIIFGSGSQYCLSMKLEDEGAGRFRSAYEEVLKQCLRKKPSALENKTCSKCDTSLMTSR